MRFAGSLHFSIYQFVPKEPALLHREGKPLLATRMSLCACDPRMVFRAKAKYFWATLVVIVENMVPLCHWLRAALDWASLAIDDEFALNYHANIVLWLTLPRFGRPYFIECGSGANTDFLFWLSFIMVQ